MNSSNIPYALFAASVVISGAWSCALHWCTHRNLNEVHARISTLESRAVAPPLPPPVPVYSTYTYPTAPPAPAKQFAYA